MQDNGFENDEDKYHVIERKNLIQLLKLSVKNFIDHALSITSGLDEEDPTLYQFFVVIEKILLHGLKDRNGIFTSRNDFYNVLQIVVRHMEWAKEVNESINNISNLRTFSGRGRAFLRLAVMQKKSHVIFTELVDNLEKVRMLYHPHALVLSEEAHIISGLLVGLNVIDCNLCLKERDLDNLPQVLQLSKYLKDGNYLDTPTPPPSPLINNHKQNYQNILEQKSYVEEINEKLRLDFLVTDKKSKMFQQDNEMLMKEVLCMKSRIEEMTSERDCLRQKVDVSADTHRRKMELEKADIAVERETYEASRHGLNELYLLAKEELVSASSKITELDRDLEVERRIKGDLEKANGLLERELLDKDDTITALRKQCAEVKKLNLNMLTRVQESDKKLAEKNVSLRDLESQSIHSSTELYDLRNRSKELAVQNEDLKKELVENKKKVYDMDANLEQAQTGCSVEKEWRENLQKQGVSNREEIARLKSEVMHVVELRSTLKQCQRENDDLRRSCSEQEKALVELGDHLSRSKVKAEELKYNVDLSKDNKWQADKETASCQNCTKQFNVSRRRHHCRNCGGIFCHQCSDNTMPLPSSSRPLRVCDGCSDILFQRSLATE